MNSKDIQKNFYKDFSKPKKGLDHCLVNKASSEIMLDRFCNGKKVEFPFLDN